MTKQCRLLILSSLTLLAGCGGSDSGAVVRTSAQAPAAASDAKEVLGRLLTTYREARTYSDKGVVLLEYQAGGQPYRESFPSNVQFARPNRLSLEAFQATVKSDGKELRARIADPLTSDVDHQFLVRPAPAELKLGDLASDALLYDILASRLQRQPIQLELLLEAGGLTAAFAGDVACKLLERGTVEGHSCYRVEVPSPGGAFVFWVDERDSLLRRLEYPAAALVPELTQDPSVTGVRLAAELREAKINGVVDEADFALAAPAGAKRMKSFVVPPRPLPSQLFGQAIGEYHFSDIDGRKVSSADLKGQVVVLAWFHDNPACAATLGQVEKAREALGGRANVTFLAVATDPASVPTSALRARLEEWNAPLSLVRDLQAFGDKRFKIELQPTITVLGTDGRLQIFQTGGNPELANQLAVIVERLARGDDLAAEIVSRATAEQAEYDKLVAVGGPEPGQVIELPEAVIKQRSEPAKLKLTELWTNRELKAPGNVYPSQAADGSPRLLVLEGWRTVTELDAAGKIVARHTLDLPEQAAITYLRTTQDKSGRLLHAAASPLAQQVFVFDQDWKLVRSYPSGDREPLRVCDLQWADLDDDESPDLLVGNVDLLGLHAVSAEGKLLWRSREFPNVISIARSTENDVGTWSLLVTGDSGGVLKVNKFGNADEPLEVKNWPIMRLVAASFPGAKQAAYLGVSSDPQGRAVVVGLNADFQESWNYPLPGGAHQKPIEAITSAQLLPNQAGQWLVAGPDGSIHILGEDGEFSDLFHVGAALNGLAATRLGEQPAIVVATDAGVTAWEVK